MESQVMIYEPTVPEGFDCLNTRNPDDYHLVTQFDGERRGDEWRPIRVRRVSTNEQRDSSPSDFPWLVSQAIAMTRPAVDAVRDLIEPCGELLPLATDDDEELWVFNAVTVNALDEGRSTLIRFPDSTKIMYVERPFFIEAAIDGRDIFRLAFRGSVTYVSERFVDRVTKSRLRGLTFKKVWSSS